MSKIELIIFDIQTIIVNYKKLLIITHKRFFDAPLCRIHTFTLKNPQKITPTHDEDPMNIAPLSTDDILRLWSQTYNHAGKPDWSHIFPYYHENIVFQDSIQRVEGRENFIALCNRLTQRCEQLHMDISSIARRENEIFMEWKMTMIFKKFPSTPVFGCTKLTFGEDHRIIHQRDYYDLWGDIFNGIPWFHRPYRKFMRRYFG